MDGHFRSSRRVLVIAQLTESAEYRGILYQKQCDVEKYRGREIAEAKLAAWRSERI